ncbi:hypothetical protein HYU13_01090, partial [Candidatus Woesearchaeota archaeon]|nr:hypothetical protein [Candidatus Woesearchaeota archaeon]
REGGRHQETIVLYADGNPVDKNLTWESGKNESANLTIMEIFETGTFNIPLLEGWNLISLPLAPGNYSITSALSSIDGNYSAVAYFNGTAKRWQIFNVLNRSNSSIEELAGEMGFWLRVSNATIFSINGTWAKSAKLNLKKGWNMIGLPLRWPRPANETYYWSNTTKIYSYENKTWKSFSKQGNTGLNASRNLMPGLGYLVRVDDDVLAVVSGQ